MKRFSSALVSVTIVAALLLLGAAAHPYGQPEKAIIAYADAKPILDTLRAELLPEELAGQTAASMAAAWPGWVARRDAAIRARVAAGDDDSVIHLLLYGTSFTRQPPIGDQELAGIVVQAGGAPAFLPSPLLDARFGDFIAAVAAPAGNERLQFARQVLARHGVDPGSAADRNRIRQYLQEQIAVIGRAERTDRLLAADTALADKLTIFRERGLSSDTSIFIDFGIEQALDAMKAAGVLRAGTVRRVALVGPGLDFVDKQHGYDFYPPQTIQPFALLDSLARFELADPAGVEIAAFDLSPRVLQHLSAVRDRARAGTPYPVVLPRSLERPWSQELVDYWERVGNWIGEPAANAPTAPPNAGRVDVRAVSIRPPVVLSVIPLDLNIVTERLVRDSAPFDLVVATNILLYYDVFEQSLAAANIAAMLRPGGVLLTNNRIFELPETPLGGVGYTDVTYMTVPGVGDAGDRIIWYQKQ